jgi:hypothetical protein
VACDALSGENVTDVPNLRSSKEIFRPLYYGHEDTKIFRNVEIYSPERHRVTSQKTLFCRKLEDSNLMVAPVITSSHASTPEATMQAAVSERFYRQRLGSLAVFWALLRKRGFEHVTLVGGLAERNCRIFPSLSGCHM